MDASQPSTSTGADSGPLYSEPNKSKVKDGNAPIYSAPKKKGIKPPVPKKMKPKAATYEDVTPLYTEPKKTGGKKAKKQKDSVQNDIYEDVNTAKGEITVNFYN